MKASEVLARYAAGERNFRGVNLEGQSLKGKDLSGADFSKADIHGADLSYANLTGAYFTGAKCGLRWHWVTLLVAISWFWAAISGLLFRLTAGLVWQVSGSNLNVQLSDVVILTLMVSLLLVIIRKGLKIQAEIVALLLFLSMFIAMIGIGAETVEGAGVRAFTLAVAFASIVVIIFALAVIFAVTFTVGRIPAVLGTVLFASVFEFSEVGVKTSVVTVAGMFTFVITGAFIAFLSMREKETDSWIRSLTIAITTMKGTKFRGAKLTDAKFVQAKLECTDLRKAVLTRVRWHEAKMVHLVRHNNTHLNNPQIRQWLIGEGIDKNFDGQSLQGINLQGEVLTDASFVNANLNGADLQNADLSGAKLVRTQIDKTDLSGAILTGACIENWGITTHTKLDKVECEYVFMRLPTKDNPNRRRKPDNWDDKFKDNDFADFIKPIFDTLDLYHNQRVDPRAVAISWKKLAEDNPDANLRYASMGVTRENNLLLRLKTEPNADLSQLSAEYFETYNQIKALAEVESKKLIAEKDDRIEALENMVNTALKSPRFYAENYNHQGDNKMAGDRDIKINKGNYNEEVKRNYYEQERSDRPSLD